GIEIVNGKAQGKTEASKKLYDLIRATGEYTIEAWLVPANVTQEGPARIVSYSAGNKARNFTLGQTLYNYNFLHRSSTTDLNGSPDLSTRDDDERLQATLQHVVLTYDPANGRRIYINAEYTGDVDPAAPGNLKDWDDSYALILGNEASGDQQWQGRIRMLAIHNRALTHAQIQQNFDAGVGQMLFMLFNISHLVDVPDSYIMFEMSRFDDYSYMFAKPTYVTLGKARPSNIRIKGIRLGINGSEAAIGQAWSNLDSTLNAARYSQTGQQLSSMGTIVPLEKGADNDEFFLTFDIIGTHTNAMSRGGNYSPTAIPLPAPASDIGLRTFEEINNTMAEVTGVTAQTDDGRSTYSTVRQQLPAVENIEGFVSAHQVAITQLAFDYCSSLVENTDLRTRFFGGSIDFNADVATAFASKTTTIDILASRLYNNMIGSNIASAPTYNEIYTELSNEIDADSDGIGDGLYEQLTSNCPTACDTTRTRSIIKGMCTAVLGSAAMLIQ
ncbi:MAG TPA: LamG domain-containing protein, partial [Gammaproteobacteria bacterium]|nr:LamG domain-containing protein [Gammaproteobacteria bacterium]